MSTNEFEDPPVPQRTDPQVGASAFNSSQSSQLFINCCFALSFSGVFFILGEALHNKTLLIAWLPFTVYLTFLIWRQYRIYCLPVQYYRPEPESDREEITTLVITLLVAGFTFSCVYAPYLTFVLLALIILLNLEKLRQIKNVLLTAPQRPNDAINDLQVFGRHLWIYLLFLVILFVVVMAFDKQLGETLFLLISALVPLMIYGIAQLSYREFVRGANAKIMLTPKEYIESVATAFQKCSGPKESSCK